METTELLIHIFVYEWLWPFIQFPPRQLNRFAYMVLFRARAHDIAGRSQLHTNTSKSRVNHFHSQVQVSAKLN